MSWGLNISSQTTEAGFLIQSHCASQQEKCVVRQLHHANITECAQTSLGGTTYLITRYTEYYCHTCGPSTDQNVVMQRTTVLPHTGLNYQFSMTPEVYYYTNFISMSSSLSVMNLQILKSNTIPSICFIFALPWLIASIYYARNHYRFFISKNALDSHDNLE